MKELKNFEDEMKNSLKDLISRLTAAEDKSSKFKERKQC